MRHANFEVLENLPDRIIIRDLGPWSIHPTVTNDAEWVVSQLIDESFPGPNNRRLFYYDSEGSLDELVIVCGKFYAFQANRGIMPRPVDDKLKHGGKCTRCGRALKRTYVVDGVPYGPICVRKLFGAITVTRDDGKVLYGTADRPKRVRKLQPVEDTSQLNFFDNEREENASTRPTE